MGTQTEREYTFYGVLKDPRQLAGAESKREIEQWLIRSADEQQGGTVRVRKSNGKCEFTVKVYRPHSGGRVVRTEADLPCSEEMFQAFKRLATRGEKMVRHVFPVPNSKLKWEVDTYAGSKWCCLDLEVGPHGGPLPPMPVSVSGLLDAADPRNDAAIARLFDSELILLNGDNILPILA